MSKSEEYRSLIAKARNAIQECECLILALESRLPIDPPEPDPDVREHTDCSWCTPTVRGA